MGFRSSFTTEHYAIDWPGWFTRKYYETVWFYGGHLASKGEYKAYFSLVDLAGDIQEAINWDKLTVPNFVLVWLHECGGITRVQIERERVLLSEPLAWEVVSNVSHWYCDGCSDVA